MTKCNTQNTLFCYYKCIPLLWLAVASGPFAPYVRGSWDGNIFLCKTISKSNIFTKTVPVFHNNI